jgi:hypothetical protein
MTSRKAGRIFLDSEQEILIKFIYTGITITPAYGRGISGGDSDYRIIAKRYTAACTYELSTSAVFLIRMK